MNCTGHCSLVAFLYLERLSSEIILTGYIIAVNVITASLFIIVRKLVARNIVIGVVSGNVGGGRIITVIVHGGGIDGDNIAGFGGKIITGGPNGYVIVGIYHFSKINAEIARLQDHNTSTDRFKYRYR